MNRKATWLWILIGAIALSALLFYLAQRFPEGLDGDGKIYLTKGVLILALIGASLVVHRRFQPGEVLRSILIWVAIGALLLLGFSYRFELARIGDRMMGELIPSSGRSHGQTVQFRASAGGHFVVEANIAGTRIRFLVDTGASDVALTPHDAARLGIDLDQLIFNKTYLTANGIIQGAPVTIPSISVGPIVLHKVRASVSRAPMSQSLLGMSFLGRLRGFEVTDQTLTLKQ